MAAEAPPPRSDSVSASLPSECDAPRWYACHTRSRAEKRVAQALKERTIEAYLPTLLRESIWSDRTRVVTIPLFPGYVFGRFQLGELHRVLSIMGVATVVRMSGRPSPIEDADIENIRRFVTGLAHVDDEIRPQPLQEGQRVRVISGPLAGVEGVVLQQRGRTSLLVGLRTIGQGIAVRIERQSLDAI
jgi:transcription antitermination factor NusG